jgi:predicted MFS family arabinose efflux permease
MLKAAPATARARGPFSHRPFAVIWAATSLSLTGIAISDAASAWLMTTIDADPRAVSLVQAASNLPMFLFTLPAGALADLAPVRTYLITLESFVVLLMASFGVAIYFQLVGPASLLAVVSILGAVWSLAAPAWMSVTPMLVPPEDLEAANAANSVGYNVSRAIGPALAGFAIARFGPQSPYWLFAAANTLSVLALLWWRAPSRSNDRSQISFRKAIRSGWRRALADRGLQHTLWRTLAVYPFASAYLALLPLVAKKLPAHGPQTFGFLLALVSIGAVFGAFMLQALRSRYTPGWTVVLGSLLLVLGLAIFAVADSFFLAAAAAVVCGTAWTIILAVLYVSAQLALPDEARCRGLGIFLTVIFGCVSLGSVFWGQLAAWGGLTGAFLTAGLMALALLPVSRQWELLGST